MIELLKNRMGTNEIADCILYVADTIAQQE